MEGKRRNWVFGTLIFVGLVGLVAAGCFFKVSKRREEMLAKKYEDRGVPVMEIKLDGVEIDEIDAGSKDIKYEGNELNIYVDGTMAEYDDVQIKGRGNTTWTQNEKKSYQIKFQQKVDLFGMGKARKWYLLANAADGTNLRTEVAFYIEDMLDMKYKFKGKFIELYRFYALPFGNS